MARAPFNGKKIVEAAEAGELSPQEIRQAIRKATELGLYDIARILSAYLVQSFEFPNDGAPEELKKKVAKGISLLKGLGIHPNRTEQMMKRRGVIATLNHIGTHIAISPNMKKMIAHGYYEYTTEAIILANQQFFSEEAIAASKEKLKHFPKPT